MLDRFIGAGVLLIGLLLPQLGRAEDHAVVQTVWRLLDGIAFDYSGAVGGGHIVGQSEHDEMVEFAGSVRIRLNQLLLHPRQPQLTANLAAPEAAIAARAQPDQVPSLARGLAVLLLDADPALSTPGGEYRWQSDLGLQPVLSTPEALAGKTPAQLAAALSDERAASTTAYPHRHPEALSQAQGESLHLARARLSGAVVAYGNGDRGRAADLALSAYLDGFEPFEPRIAAKDSTLPSRVEAAMNELRSAITRGQPTDIVERQAAAVRMLFDETEGTLATDVDSDAAIFVGAATILLREGMEALLIVVAMIAFLRKAGRENVLPYVHGGWVAALVAGSATWGVATYLIAISGASRELTEGFGSLFAALMLVFGGIWMHGKSQADHWQFYIRERLSQTLSRRSGWVLFLLAFVVVYREVFETILFYSAMWRAESAAALLGGVAWAVVLLGIIGWAGLRYSRQLPIGRFFTVSSLLVVVLSIVLAGKGVAALQEAGLLDAQPLTWLPQLAVLGFYPTAEGAAAQLLILTVVIIGFWHNRRLKAAP